MRCDRVDRTLSAPRSVGHAKRDLSFRLARIVAQGIVLTPLQLQAEDLVRCCHLLEEEL